MYHVSTSRTYMKIEQLVQHKAAPKSVIVQDRLPAPVFTKMVAQGTFPNSDYESE